MVLVAEGVRGHGGNTVVVLIEQSPCPGQLDTQAAVTVSVATLEQPQLRVTNTSRIQSAIAQAAGVGVTTGAQ